MEIKDLKEAHKFCYDNKKYLINDTKCGCFYCLKIFDPKLIKECSNEKSGTALCPYCGIDSVIAEKSGYKITDEFMNEMHKFWFGE